MRTAVISAIAVFITGLVIAGNVGAVVLKIATLSPDGSSWMEKMRAGGREVAEKTGER